MNTHSLRLIEIAMPEHLLVDEAFTGTDWAAEQRLGDIWNGSLAAIDGERYRATAQRTGEQRPFMTIGW